MFKAKTTSFLINSCFSKSNTTHWFPTDTGTPIQCSPGYYNNQTQSDSPDDCESCDGGSYCATAGLTTPTGLCSAGFYCTGNSTEAAQATVCTFVGRAAGFEGTDFWSDFLNQTCNASGSVYEIQQQSESVFVYFLFQESTTGGPCRAGTYCPEGSTLPLACAGGSYAPNDTMAACDMCPAGSYCSQGASAKDECQPGYYCPENSTFQQPCDKGTYNNQSGLSTNIVCWKSYVKIEIYDTPRFGALRWLNSSWLEFTSLTFSTQHLGQGSVDACLPCDPGNYCPNSSMSKPEGQCAPGW